MKFSLSTQASTLLAMRDRGAIDALAHHAHLKESERDYFEGVLMAAIATLRLLAEHEDAVRAVVREREAAKCEAGR